VINTQQSATQPKKSSGFNRQFFQTIFKSLVVIFIICCLLIGFLLTSWGAKTVINNFNSRVHGLNLDYQSGGLGSELRLSSIKWQQPGSQVFIQDFRLSLKLSCVWRLALCIDSVAAKKTLVQLQPTDTTTNTGSTDSVFTLPFPIFIQTLNLTQFNIKIKNNVDISWQQLTAKLDFYQHLRVENMQLSGFNLSTLATESKDTHQSAVIDWADWQYDPIKSLPIKLPIHFDIMAFDVARANFQLAGQPEFELKSIHLKAQGNSKQVQISELLMVHNQGQLLAKGNVQLNGDFKHLLSIDASGQWLEHAPLKFTLRSNGNIDSLTTQLELIETKVSAVTQTLPLKLSANLMAQASKANLPNNLQVNWQNLAWPFDSPQFHSDQGNLDLNGDLQTLKMTLDTILAGQNVPETQISLVATANLTAQNKVLELQELLLQSLGGQVSSQGRLTWSKFMSWQGSSNVSHIDPSVFWPQWAADINGEIITKANNNQGVWQAMLQRLDIHGQWQGYPLNATGQMDFEQNKGLKIHSLLIKNANNSLLLNGAVSESQALNIDFILDAAELSNTIPQLAGMLNLVGKVAGSAQQPELNYELSGTELKIAEVFIERATGKGKINWSGRKSMDLNLELQGIQGINNQIDNTNITLTGDAEAHRFELTTTGKSTSVNIAIQGQLQQNSWQGKWLSGDIVSSYANLTLLEPFTIEADWATQEYSVSPHCWSHTDNELCIKQAEFKQNTALWDLSLKEFNLLSVIHRLVPRMPIIQTASRLNLDMSGDWQIEQLPNVNLQASFSAGDWVFNQKNNLQLSIDKMSFDTQINQQNILTKIHLVGNEIGILSSSLQAQSGLFEDPLNRPIEGELVIDGFNLAPLKVLVPQLEILQGVINGQAQIDGTLGKPLLKGAVNLTNAALKDESLPVVLNAIEQNIVLNGDSADFVGSYKFGQGAGKMDGSISWTHSLAGSLHIWGEALEFDYQNILKAKVSPNINLVFEANNLEISGEVTVPYARVKVRKLPEGSISASQDVILVEQQAQQDTTQQRMAVNILVKVDPFDNKQVKLDAFGLTTDLQGQLRIQNNKSDLFASGEMKLVNGRYRAYGQNLIIRQGDILFNSSITRPFLSIEAVRDPNLTADDVLAGLRVEGDAQNPTVTVFSEPDMEQQQSLSYMLTGQGLGESNSDSQDVVLTNALLSIGLGKSENFISKVGNKLGFEDVGLDTSGQGGNTQLSLTGTIAPGVQLRYGVGVFDSVSEVAIRYELLPKLYLEAVSGLNNAIDIYYQFSVEGSQNKRVSKE
jgi:translocation and assembly module TamB